MQRVAIARVMAASPRLILADEPTGNLDSKTGERIMDLITGLNDAGTAIAIVTHDPQVASRAKKTFIMKDGCFV
jgi:putative ABC transport system ATP-binding protein